LIGYPAAQKYLGYVSMVRGEEKAGPPSSIYVRAATGHEAEVQSLLAQTANPEAPNEVNVSQPSGALGRCGGGVRLTPDSRWTRRGRRVRRRRPPAIAPVTVS